MLCMWEVSRIIRLGRGYIINTCVGTYFPPVGNYGRPGFTQILEAVSSKWEDNKVS